MVQAGFFCAPSPDGHLPGIYPNAIALGWWGRAVNRIICADVVKKWCEILWIWKKVVPLHSGKSYTASSLRIPQVLTEARVFGCSGAM